MTIPLIVLALIGLFVYGFVNGKIGEVGRILFMTSLLALLLHGGMHLRLTS